jgi:hypothetical protein
MRPMIATKTGTGESSPLVLDHYRAPFNVGFAVVVSGTVTYTVQHTFDDILNSSVTPTWFSHEELAGQTASADGNYAFPVRAIRLSNTAGSGTTTLTAIQAGSPGR